ncbi:PA14 domain-containing protein [Labilibaculum euxinus]
MQDSTHKTLIRFSLLFFIFSFSIAIVCGQEVTLAEYQFSTNGDMSAEAGAIGNPNLNKGNSIGFSGSYGNLWSSLYTNVDGQRLELSISTVGYKDIKVEWDGGYWYGNTNKTHQWLLSADSGAGYGGTLYTQNCQYNQWEQVSYSLSSGFDNNSGVKIRITSNVSNSRYVYLDNLKIKGTLLAPDTEDPVFQNPQTDITVNASGSNCGEIVNYDIPQAIDNFPAFSGTLPGYTYLGELYNHTYYYSNTSEKATTAMQNAINSGGHLVTITSQAENDFIDSKVGDIWIGLTDAAAEGTFVWCNGEAVSYTNWNSGEPNNSGNEDYTQMYSNGKWNDIPDTYWKRYVVEFEGVLVTQTGGLPSGSLFPVGTTVNTFTATDNAGNTATHSFNVTVADVTPPKISQLQADYYDGKNFDTFMETLPVDEINYSWGSGAPESSLVGNDNFSIRFQGSIQAVQAGTYTFYTTSDDGVRLWVAGQQVINNWTNHSPTVNSGTISLSAGQIVPIVLEFYEQGGGAVIKLEWQGPGVSRQFVKSNSTGTCQDITLDLSAAGGLYNLTADEVDPGYSDECGIASRSLSKSVFTCDDAGSNSVTFTVVDVNGNSSECIIDVIVTGVPDISLPVIGDTKCIGDGAQLTIQGSEGGVVYSAYKGGVQIGSSVPGNGADVSINIPTLGFSVGDNLINIKAVSAVCEANLTNTGIIVIYQSPNPVGIYHE